MKIQPWFKLKASLQLPNQNQGTLFISNHRSHLDAFILLSHIQGIRMLTRKSLFFIPFLNVMMILTRQIPSERGHVDSLLNAFEKIKKSLKDKERILIFPEMTRCQKGFKGVQSFSLLPFQLALKENLTVYPLVIKNTDQVWAKNSVLINPSFPIEILSLPPVSANLFSSAVEFRDFVRSQIEQELARSS